MNLKRSSHFVLRLFLIAVGAAVYSFGVALFLDPNSLAPGGVTGIAVILSHLGILTTGTLFFVLNIPIMALGLYKFGLHFIAATIYAVALVSAFSNLLGGMPPVTSDPLLAAIAGGALTGIGIGIIFKCGGTTGGEDIIVKVLRAKRPQLKTGTFFMIIDAAIVACSGFVFRDFNVAMYAMISVVTTAQVLNWVLYGTDEARLAFIISERHEAITARILQQMDVGATYLHATGSYTMSDKKVIMCAVKKHDYPVLEEIVKEEDDSAFLIVSSASEIYGEGYKNILAEKL